MIDAETLRFIRREITRQVQVILSGETGATAEDTTTENINNLLPGMPTITNRPVMHPYGFASRAPKKTIQVTARQGEHAGNRLVLGHRAADRPDDLLEGESAHYSSGGYQIRARNGKIELGKDGEWKAAVLGEALNDILVAFLTEYLTHAHTGNLGAPTTPPLVTTAATQAKSDLTAGKNLAMDGGAF